MTWLVLAYMATGVVVLLLGERLAHWCADSLRADGEVPPGIPPVTLVSAILMAALWPFVVLLFALDIVFGGGSSDV